MSGATLGMSVHPKWTKKKAFCFAAAFSLKDMKHPKHRDRETSEKT